MPLEKQQHTHFLSFSEFYNILRAKYLIIKFYPNQFLHILRINKYQENTSLP